MRQSIRDYILERVEHRMAVPGFTPCWEWTLVPGGSGYALIKMRGCRGAAHRASYTEFTGPIPEGYEVDHLCANRICVNPDHLEAVTKRVNIQRMNERVSGRRYAIFQRSDSGLWVARVETGGPGERKRKQFASLDREKAVARAQAFLASIADTRL